MTNRLITQLKSLMFCIGLFCLQVNLTGCYPATNPREVTVAFWTAMSENDAETARQYTAEQMPLQVDKKLRNAFVQTGKVAIDYDTALVETQLSLRTAANTLAFHTFLIREQQTDKWYVSYQQTIHSMPSPGLKSIVTSLKETGQEAKQQVKENGKSWFKNLWHNFVALLKKLKNKLTE
jgi:hypothetical protein